MHKPQKHHWNIKMNIEQAVYVARKNNLFFHLNVVHVKD